MRLERADTLDDCNKMLAQLEGSGRKVIKVWTFNYTMMKEDGMPMQLPIFYILHDKGIIKV